MKSKFLALPAAVFVLVVLSACGPSVEQIALDRQNARTSQDLARREAIDELKLAKERAKGAGAAFADDGKLIRAYQCDTRLGAERLGQVPGYKRFADEMKQPFREGCVREARAILHHLQLVAQQAAKERAAKRARLASKGAGNKK